MTIDLSDNNPRINYAVAQGVTQAVFSVPFEFFNSSDVTAYVDGTLKSEGSDYTLSGGDGSTGTLTFTPGITGASGGSTVTLVRHIALERTTDFVAGQDINRAALNEELDTIVGLIADLDDRVDRTIHLNDSEVAPSMLLTDDRKGRVMAFNSSTGAVEAGPLSNDIATIADNIDELLAVNDEAAAAAASATAAATSASAASTSATAAQTAQTAAELAETNAETAETNAETAETNAAASAAAALASETAAAASEAGVDADRVAAQAAATAAAASETAAATSETNAATSETNAANSATASASSATASAASATAASASENAADLSAIAAAASETAAATSETNAATSATTATTKASEASASATAAASSASASATSATDTEAARDQSQDARDTANLHKLAAEAAATSATNTAAALTGFDLDAIAESKSVTAADVFVYDTSKDSDGGAWRKRTQGTSWYNETLNTATRGSRKEFPAVAVIVAESTKVTIYDGDDPSLPMWMVFNASTVNNSFNVTAIFGHTGAPITSISAFNGEVVVGCEAVTSNLGVRAANFVSDSAWYKRNTNDMAWLLTLADRNANDASVKWVSVGSQDIVNHTINDVAMTVLPNAPIDAATGLPVPTIACLVAETEVAMADGSTKRLDQVVVGDVVKTLEGEHAVLNWWDQGIKGVIELEFEGGQKITCTSDHKIRTTEGWVEAGDLTDAHEVVGL